MNPSRTHLVLIPSFNPGVKGLETVRAARAQWAPVWVVVDGSTDGSAEAFRALARNDPQLRLLVRGTNGGKGAAIHDGLAAARRAGFTHALTMDSDGQHPPECIRPFMAASQAAPQAMILGVPQFDASVPLVRLRGRRISNGCTNVLTLWAGIKDTLFGFRVYPIEPLFAVMQASRWMRGFDFDPEAAVRLSWHGVPAVNLAAPVRYFSAAQGGTSHFNYLRDNALLAAMNLRLLGGCVLRLPLLIARRLV
jgi:glycosyltransferase involved in cell wall biosynthesis